ncbi:MAG: iron-containing alcohol dehydrogenase [Caldilineales bacterium]|nr:iron-containing alcohol dehydrogenase [Caldilineales bacterium]
MNRYLWPGQVYLGAGAAGLTGAQAQALGCRRAFLIVDPGILPAGLLAPVAAALAAAGMQVAVYDQVVPNPDTASVDAATAALRASGADVIVGLGGGSALDTAKAVRLAAGGPAAASVWEYAYLHGDKARPAPPRCACLPLILLPTTAGTGAEATPWAVLTHMAGHHKYGVGADHLLPDVALIDPDLTLTLPTWLTAATGIDALSHLIEAYVSTNQNPLLDPLILRGVALVGQHLRRAVEQGEEGAARQGMMEAALLGGIAITSNWLGACHSLAHQLSSFAGLHHGVAIALMLPAQMAFSLPAAPARYAAIGQALNGAADAVDAVRDLIAAVGLPTRLRDAGVDESLIPAMAASAYTNDLNWTTNPRPIDQAGLEQLYRQAW